jgi:hypothetical protein
LEDLLAQAHEGRLIGFAYVAMHQPRAVTGGIAGEPKKSPIAAALVLGMLSLLEDDLRELIRPDK